MYQLYISSANACAVDNGMERQSYNKDPPWRMTLPPEHTKDQGNH